MAVLRQVASPTMSAPALKKWAENKIAVLRRAQASGRVFEEWVSENERVPRGVERDKLQKAMLAAADAVTADPGLVELGGSQDAATAKVTPGKDPKTGIVTLSDGSRWNADGTEVKE